MTYRKEVGADMVNDRQIVITVGNNRKSVNWQPQTIMLSEHLYALAT